MIPLAANSEVNHGPGIVLAMCHRIKLFIHLKARDLQKGDENPAYIAHGVRNSLL